MSHDSGRKEARVRMNQVRGAFIDMERKPEWVFKIDWDADFKISQGRSSRRYMIEFRAPINLAKLIKILDTVEADLENAFDY